MGGIGRWGRGCFELMKVKGVLYALWQFCRYLFWPQWGSKRRRAQEEDERMLEEELLPFKVREDGDNRYGVVE